MRPHTHMSPVHAVAMLAMVIATLMTIHLLAVSSDSRASRAILAGGL